jgi:hypothetical protein
MIVALSIIGRGVQEIYAQVESHVHGGDGLAVVRSFSGLGHPQATQAHRRDLEIGGPEGAVFHQHFLVV